MEKRKDYNKFDSAYMFFASIIIVQAIVLFVFVFYGIISKQMGVELETFTTYTIVKYLNTIIIQLIFLCIFLIYNKRKKIDFVTATKFNVSLNIKSLLLIIVIALVCLFGFLPFINMVDHILELIGVKLSTDLAIPLNNFGQFSLAVLFVAVAPAIIEELIFRGIIFNGLLKSNSAKKAIILSAFMFCIMHLSVQQTVYQLILGVVLALAVYYTGSLLASIVLHFINNFVVILYSYVNKSVSSNINTFLTALDYIAPILIALAVGVVLWFLFKALKNVNKKTKEQSVQNEMVEAIEEKQEGILGILYNPTFIIVCTFIVALLFWTTSFFS